MVLWHIALLLIERFLNNDKFFLLSLLHLQHLIFLLLKAEDNFEVHFTHLLTILTTTMIFFFFLSVIL